MAKPDIDDLHYQGDVEGLLAVLTSSSSGMDLRIQAAHHLIDLGRLDKFIEACYGCTRLSGHPEAVTAEVPFQWCRRSPGRRAIDRTFQ